MTTAEQLCMDMGRATGDCTPCPVDEDVWTQVARHGPGQVAGSSSVTNRSIVYRLHPPDGPPFLVVLNGLWVDEEADQPFEGLRALESTTGARVRFILAPGGSHHLSLTAYARAFPEARVCVADGRIPRTNAELVAEPNVEVYPPASPPPELEAAGLRVHVVAGLMEGVGARRLQRIVGGNRDYHPDSTEPLVVLHVPTGSITSGGHQWWFLPADEAVVFHHPVARRLILRVLSLAQTYLTPGHIVAETNRLYAIHDREALQASAAEILSWEFDALIDLHAPPNKGLRVGARRLFEELLEPLAAGQWDRVPWAEGSLPRP